MTVVNVVTVTIVTILIYYIRIEYKCVLQNFFITFGKGTWSSNVAAVVFFLVKKINAHYNERVEIVDKELS